MTTRLVLSPSARTRDVSPLAVWRAAFPTSTGRVGVVDSRSGAVVILDASGFNASTPGRSADGAVFSGSTAGRSMEAVAIGCGLGGSGRAGAGGDNSARIGA